jgi:hypothetical protein
MVGTSWLQGTSRDGEMHDHVHNPVLPRVTTVSDRKWRASDTMAIRRQIPAIQATTAAYVEAALSRELGVAWVPRADGAGNEIAGINQAEIDAFSSRRDSVTAKQADLAEQFRGKYGRTPSQRELLSIHRTAWAATRDAKPEGPIDFYAAAREWGAEWTRRFGTPLAALASRVADLRGPARASRDQREKAREPDPRTLADAARVALARVQASHPTWTRAELMRQVKVSLPAEALGTDPRAAVRLVNELTDRAVAGEFEPVQCLESPEVVALPDSLRRPLDGRSVYTRPGSVRYATRVQLSLEERLVANAQAETTARLSPEQGATQLGADAAILDEQLSATATQAREQMAGSGLRMDQAAAVFHALTSPRVAEVLIGPAGSGKMVSVLSSRPAVPRLPVLDAPATTEPAGQSGKPENHRGRTSDPESGASAPGGPEAGGKPAPAGWPASCLPRPLTFPCTRSTRRTRTTRLKPARSAPTGPTTPIPTESSRGSTSSCRPRARPGQTSSSAPWTRGQPKRPASGSGYGGRAPIPAARIRYMPLRNAALRELVTHDARPEDMTRTISFFAAGAGVLALAACGGSTSGGTPAAGTTTHQTAHQAAVSCKQQYDTWKTGPAKTVANRIQADLSKVTSAANAEDVPELNSALHAAGNDARSLKAYPMPVCADPSGDWAKMLGYIQAAGDNASTSSGLSGLVLAMAPLEKVKGVENKLTAELKKDAKAAS